MNPLRRHGGFTMLELLVAVSITVALAAVMLTVTTGTLNLWRRTQDTFTTDAQARLVLDYLERDLQAAIFRPDAGTWLAVDVINDSGALAAHGWLTGGTIKPATSASRRYVPTTTNGIEPTIADARFGLSGAWLRFITTNLESGGSNPVAVSYQIARRPVGGALTSANTADVRYTFFRSAVRPASSGSSPGTFESGYDLSATNTAYYTPISGANIAGVSYQRHPTTVITPHAVDFIATNVVDFGVWLYTRENSGVLTRVFPIDNTATAYAANSASSHPVVADVMIRVLSDEGAKLIEAIETGGGASTRPANFTSQEAWWWGVVEANSRVYVRRIEMKSSSL